MTEFTTIRIDHKNHLAEVVLLEKTMRPVFFNEIGAAFEALTARDDVRAVVVHSEAKSFTYGLDLPAAFQEMGEVFSGGTAKTRTQLLTTIRNLQRAFTAIELCPIPVLAAVHGHCIGGGIDLITACDMRYGTTDSTYSVRETKIAIVADLGTLQRLPKVIAPGHARELVFTGKDISADRARDIGLLNDVATDKAKLLEHVRGVASEIAANPPLTVRGTKEVMRYGQDRSTADGLEYVAAWNAAFLASEDLGEAINAFMAKRPPVYKGS